MSLKDKLFKKKAPLDGEAGDAGANTETAESKIDAKAAAREEAQRAKKITNMKKKFDETVWQSNVDIMKRDIPQFVIVEDDPDLEGAKTAKYVLLGFDTKIVDDFSNKSDDDVGSMMTAIKASMDCVIEEALLANELILMIPTERTMRSLYEFEETFDMKLNVVYVTETHNVSIETVSPDSTEPLTLTLADIRSMIANNVHIADKIAALRGDAAASRIVDKDDITAPDDYYNDRGDDDEVVPDEDEIPDGDAVPEEEIPDDDAVPEEEIPGDEAVPEGEAPPEPAQEPAAAKSGSGEKVKNIAAEAVANAERIANLMDETAGEIGGEAQGAPAQSPQPDNPGDDGAAARAEIAARAAKLSDAVQKASDAALSDTAVKNAQANINPQARVFDMAAMDQYITRRYYSDDLGLEISSEPFDSMFLQNNPYTPFTEIENDTWLEGYVNNLRRDANTRMAKLHQENIMLMRERYMLIIMKHCESVVRSVSTDDPKTRFGYALSTIEEAHRKKVESIGETSENYKRECEDDYQRRMDAYVKNAASTAKIQFERDNKPDHDRALKEIETDLRNNIESEYIQAVENLKDARRVEAKRQLDKGITEALKLCADEYTKMLAMERKEYNRLQNVITEFQNDNMASDQARILTLAEGQRRENEVTKVRREYDAKYALANKEFESKLLSAKADIERINIEHENHVAEIREQHERMMQSLRDAQAEQIGHKDTEIKTLNDQLALANRQIEALTVKYADLDEKTGKKYATQIDMLRSEREAWTEHALQAESLHKYTDKIKLTTMIIGVIAALALGIIIGCAIVANSVNKSNKEPVINYYGAGDTVSDTSGDDSNTLGMANYADTGADGDTAGSPGEEVAR